MHAPAPASPSAPNTRAAVTRGLLIAALVLMGAGAALTWWLSRPAPESQAMQPGAVADAPGVTASADPYATARSQIAADQIATPAGNNAIETYLGLLAARPDDASARQALTELLPFAARLGERAGNAGDLTELERLMALIEAADPNYTQLRTLRGRHAALLLARETQAARDAQAAAVRVSPADPRTTTSAPDPTPVATPAAAPTSIRPNAAVPPAATSPERITPTPAVPPEPAPVATSPAAGPAVTPAPATDTAARSAVVIEAEQINTVAPAYPPAARARRLEGWVEVELVVDVRGMPREVNVVNAQPAGVFNREAERAASRWRFKPRSIDGTPVESRIRRRINFRLPD